MERHKAERALRRLVADLAGARQEDIDAVLGELSGEQRRKVEGLLRAYRGQPDLPAEPVKAAPLADTPATLGFSPAIACRIDPAYVFPPARAKGRRGEAAAIDAGAWRMTDGALQVLRACARQLPASAQPAGKPKRAAGLWGGLARARPAGARRP